MDYVFAGYRVVIADDGLVSMSECMTDVVGADSYNWEMFFTDRALAEQACPSSGQLFAVGFPREDVPALLADFEKFEPIGAAGMPDRLLAGEPMPCGDVLGCELVGWDSGPSVWHTWACLGGLVDDVRDVTGVVPGEHGLIQDVEQARLAARWLTASELGDPKVFLWVPALLVRPAG
ncbi:hypothetical protein C8D87_107362 [Lentzea atacamensis]|uniref:Uncharacterized protein n=1 Tax=Lentzea atacamensis TaxID=531938 RepID=A0ABX9E361_9PSEU|nr:hypothetical protein [Lentzea atacamensis]RAS63213.1 hypothetical protein C8D87_107362 [Lentzea atacamensis]